MPDKTAIRVLQFGTSRFLQAHADLFLDEAKAGPVAVIASSGGASGRDRVRAFGAPEGYPVIIRGIENGTPIERTQQIHVVTQGLTASDDWPDILRIAATEAEIILSNTTEAGLAHDNDRVDIADPARSVPPSFPGKLLACLAARFAAGGAPVSIFPTELVDGNGRILQGLVTALAEQNHASPAFLAWLGGSCRFANSLVDRIVSEAIDPVGAVAEPYALWAIETQPGLAPPCIHPAIRMVPDLQPYQRLKVHILNLGHTFLAQALLDGGWPQDVTVRQMMQDPRMRASLTTLYDDEVLPGFTARGMPQEAAEYIATTLSRFDNPYLAHRVSDIAKGHETKIGTRVAGFLAWVDAAGPVAMPRLRAWTARRG